MADETTTTTEPTTEAAAETPAKKARAKKPTLFAVGDTVITPQGEAVVQEVHGRGWVKVDGVPKAWHKIVDLEELNPKAAEVLKAKLEEMEKAKATKSPTGSKKAKLEARIAKAEARVTALNETITKLKAELAGLGDEGEAPAAEDGEGESDDSDEAGE